MIDSLTDPCLVDLTDVTLAYEDANSKLVDIITVFDEDRVSNSLLQIWEMRFGHKAEFCSDFEHPGQDFKVEVQARF